MPLVLWTPGRQRAQGDRPERAIRCAGGTGAAGLYGLRAEALNNPGDFFDKLGGFHLEASLF